MLRKGTFILMKTKIQDMTSGSPGRLIILFAIPLMLGNICQQLYTMVDTMVVGQVAGVEALAALGAVDFLMWVVTGISQDSLRDFPSSSPSIMGQRISKICVNLWLTVTG